jgi:hypothetical protein
MPEFRRDQHMHIKHAGEPVAQGEEFTPTPGYNVEFVRHEGMRIVLRDGHGEFSRWITDRTPHSPPPVVLGERRTVLEPLLHARPIVNEAIYRMTHQMCVPGGWQDIKSLQVRAPLHMAGLYAPNGSDIENAKLRQYAATLWKETDKVVADHPYTRLGELLVKVRLQEGEMGLPDSWDDPAVVMEIVELLDKSRTF